jgi:NAD+ kinase
MKGVGILHHPKIPSSQPLAAAVEAWLSDRSVAVWSGSTWDQTAIDRHISGLELLVVLGGDGSILRAAAIAAPHDVPLFGINLGQLGFLSEVEPGDWQRKLAFVLAGEHWLERRLMLYARVVRDGQAIFAGPALNEVVVGRGTQARVVSLQLLVDDAYVTSYVADGVIVATPTGSTAYALAAGGPILPPQLANYLTIPVAPHLCLDRALVLHQEARMTLRVFTDHEAMLTTDGRDTVALQSGDEVCIEKHAHDGLFARVDPPGYFYQRLLERLSFGTKWRPDGTDLNR